MLGQLRKNLDEFVWHHFDSVEAVAAARHQSMTAFLGDYGGPDRGDRYLKYEFQRGGNEMLVVSRA